MQKARGAFHLGGSETLYGASLAWETARNLYPARHSPQDVQPHALYSGSIDAAVKTAGNVGSAMSKFGIRVLPVATAQ